MLISTRNSMKNKKFKKIVERSYSIIKRLRTTDYIVIVISLTLLSLVLLFYSRKKTSFYISFLLTPQEIRHDIYSPQYWIGKSLQPGDVAFDGVGRKVATIVSIDDSDVGGYQRQLSMILELNGMYDHRTKQYRINDTIIEVGKNVDFSFSHTQIKGSVVDIGESIQSIQGEKRSFELILFATNIDPWLAESYREPFVSKNREGETQFEIKKVKIVPAKKSITTDEGEIKCALDPIYKDVFLSAEVSAVCYEGVCYYQNSIPIKIGQTIIANTNTNQITNSRIVSMDKEKLEEFTENNTCK